MDKEKETAIMQIIDSTIKGFVEGFELRYTSEIDDPLGVINSKKNNCFIAELGKEFMFYSAFVRSFDSSFGRILENMGNAIAKLSYEVRSDIVSYLLPQQSQHMDFLMTEYEHHVKPQVSDYKNFTFVVPRDLTSYTKSHKTDNY
ncbi:MAG: TdeIII family type II restriction endonuclease [Candidatus Gastranaerophilales bacterium]|nr:TdeIII family type II restriction endonuclease [Candidatus Gastranaerophilales bacterium]